MSFATFSVIPLHMGFCCCCCCYIGMIAFIIVVLVLVAATTVDVCCCSCMSLDSTNLHIVLLLQWLILMIHNIQNTMHEIQPNVTVPELRLPNVQRDQVAIQSWLK